MKSLKALMSVFNNKLVRHTIRRRKNISKSEVETAANEIRRSRLFDAEWYCQMYKDVSANSLDPIIHYIVHGAQENRFPNPFFDTKWYREQYLIKINCIINPLIHFATHGKARNLDPNEFFSTNYYLDTYEDIASSPEIANGKYHPLVHYLEWGCREHRSVGPHFSLRMYMAQYRDSRDFKYGPLAHYLHFGRVRGFDPLGLQFPCAIDYSKLPTALDGEVLDVTSLTSRFTRPAVVGLAGSSEYESVYNSIFFTRFQNVIVASGTDLIVGRKYAYWSKARHPLFPMLKPLDKFYDSHDDNKVHYLNSWSKTLIVGSAFSMLGLFDAHWAHFLVQYLPKMRYLHQNRIIDKDLILLLPARLDNQQRHIVEFFYKDICGYYNLMYIDDDTKVECSALYYADHQSWLADSRLGPGFISGVVPNESVKFVRKILAEIDSLPLDKRYEKIYLRRAGPRSVINIDELDHLLHERGFQLFDPGNAAVAEKRAIFQSAKLIVGPFSSSFTNLIFCGPRVEAVILTNTYRIEDPVLPVIADEAEARITYVVGVDEWPNTPDTSYTINIEELKKVLALLEV